MIPAITVTATMLFGIEEIGTQLEEPFTVLPMQAFCDKIYNWCMEIVSWVPGDSGREMKEVKPQHAFFTSGAGDYETVNGSQDYYDPAPVMEAAVATPPPPPPAEEPVYEAEPPAPQTPATEHLSFEEFLKSQQQHG